MSIYCPEPTYGGVLHLLYPKKCQLKFPKTLSASITIRDTLITLGVFTIKEYRIVWNIWFALWLGVRMVGNSCFFWKPAFVDVPFLLQKNLTSAERINKRGFLWAISRWKATFIHEGNVSDTLPAYASTKQERLTEVPWIAMQSEQRGFWQRAQR